VPCGGPSRSAPWGSFSPVSAHVLRIQCAAPSVLRHQPAAEPLVCCSRSARASGRPRRLLAPCCGWKPGRELRALSTVGVERLVCSVAPSWHPPAGWSSCVTAPAHVCPVLRGWPPTAGLPWAGVASPRKNWDLGWSNARSRGRMLLRYRRVRHQDRIASMEGKSHLTDRH